MSKIRLHQLKDFLAIIPRFQMVFLSTSSSTFQSFSSNPSQAGEFLQGDEMTVVDLPLQKAKAGGGA